MDCSIASQTLIARLSSFFGVVAVFLACIGIYGLLSSSCRPPHQRTWHPAGARRAIGLAAVDDSARIGFAVGYWARYRGAGGLEFHARAQSLLYELSPLDPMAISIAIGAVVVMTIAAAFLPALRATKINPMHALRAE